MSRNHGSVSLKDKFVGLIRHLSQPNTSSGQRYESRNSTPRPDSFIHKYLQGEGRVSQPPIVHGRFVEELPPHALGKVRRRVHAAFSGPGGGLTSVNKRNPALEISEPDVGFIDGDDMVPDAAPNAYVTSRSPPPPPNPDLKRSESEEIAGITNWNRPNERAFGLSTTLYERHPITNERAGNPIADAFGVVARENNAFLVLGDGVNWGEKASLAARCAVHGCLNYLNTALFSPGVCSPSTTTEIFIALLRSFHAAHSLILEEGGVLTTLTAAVVSPIQNSDQYVICVCNVGDSLAYVISKQHGVREITQGSHDIYSMRDMRDALGALGPVDGQNPELNNLTCSMTVCDENDIVFLTSDGISDNFDPVVGKFALPKAEPKERSTKTDKQLLPPQPGNPNITKNKKNYSLRAGGHSTSSVPSSTSYYQRSSTKGQRSLRQKRQQTVQGRRNPQQTSNVVSDRIGFRQPVSRSKSQPVVSETTRHMDPFLPVVEAYQRHELTLLRMEDLLHNGLTSPGPVENAQALCLEMVHFATKLTVAKRRILEDPDLYPPAGSQQDFSRNEQRNRRRKVCEKLALVPGKLDHATVVAYTVGHFSSDSGCTDSDDEEVPLLSKSPTEVRKIFRAPLASPDSSRSIWSQFEDSKSRDSLAGVSVLPTFSKLAKLAAKEEFNSVEEEDEQVMSRTNKADVREGQNMLKKSRESKANLEKENKPPKSVNPLNPSSPKRHNLVKSVV